jgi:hypothetical protein
VDETSTDLLDFLRIQLTSALAIQYSVLVIHVFFSFCCFGAFKGSKLVKRDLPGRPIKGGPLKLAFTDEVISVAAKIRVPGACSKGAQASGNALGLFPVQFTSTLANQHSVLVIHTFLLFSSFWVRWTGPSSSEEFCPAARQQGLSGRTAFH